MRFRRYAPIAILMAFLVWLVAFTGCFGTAELFAHDCCVKWLPSHPQARNPQVILVLVHDSDINRWRQADKNRTSIPDDELVNVIDHLESMGARAIGIDLYRDDPTFPKDQIAPATKGARSPLETAFYNPAHVSWNNVVFGWAVKADKNPGLPAFLPPNFILNDMGRFARQIGYVEVAPSSDSVIRTWCLFMTSSGQDSRISKKIPTITSLDFQLAWIALHGQQASPAIRFDRSNERLLLGGVDWPKVEEDLRPTSDKKLLYRIPADFSSFGGSAQQQLIRLSLDEVVQESQKARQNVSDSIVLIGRDSSDASDGPFKTPLGMENRLSGNVDDGEDGIVLHARCVDQLVLASQRKLYPLNTLNGFLRLAWDMFWSLLVAMLFAAIPGNPWRQAVMAMLFLGALNYAFYLLLRMRWFSPDFEPATTILLTCTVLAWRTRTKVAFGDTKSPARNTNRQETDSSPNLPATDRQDLLLQKSEIIGVSVTEALASDRLTALPPGTEPVVNQNSAGRVDGDCQQSLVNGASDGFFNDALPASEAQAVQDLNHTGNEKHGEEVAVEASVVEAKSNIKRRRGRRGRDDETKRSEAETISHLEAALAAGVSIEEFAAARRKTVRELRKMKDRVRKADGRSAE